MPIRYVVLPYIHNQQHKGITTMLTIADINNIETEEDVNDVEYYQSIQRAINAKSWSLQGSYGRTMMEAITSGYCLLGKESTRDYWGNTIPSRDDVKAGTKGSYDYVSSLRGADWAELMEAV
jgi:hypothetical protein